MSDTQSVVVTDFNISFSLMVILLVKFALANASREMLVKLQREKGQYAIS